MSFDHLLSNSSGGNVRMLGTHYSNQLRQQVGEMRVRSSTSQEFLYTGVSNNINHNWYTCTIVSCSACCALENVRNRRQRSFLAASLHSQGFLKRLYSFMICQAKEKCTEKSSRCTFLHFKKCKWQSFGHKYQNPL